MMKIIILYRYTKNQEIVTFINVPFTTNLFNFVAKSFLRFGGATYFSYNVKDKQTQISLDVLGKSFIIVSEQSFRFET